MNVLSPSYNDPNETENWRHECTNCNLVRLEKEMRNGGGTA